MPQLYSELNLPHLPIDQAAFAIDPQPYLEAARRKHPWLATSDLGLVVFGYEELKQLLDHDKLTTSLHMVTELLGAEGTEWGRHNDAMIASKNGEEHKRIRDIVAPAFTPRKANRLRPVMRQVVQDLLDEWAPRGSFDFAEFASLFPITVMFSLIGAPSEAIARIKSSLETQGAAFGLDPAILPTLQQAFTVLWDFVDEVVTERIQGRRVSDRPDLLDDVIEARKADGLNDEELRELLYFLFAAGYDTSKNLLTTIMNLMLDRPADWARCGEDRAFCARVVEEALRHSSVVTTPRLVASDLVYRDVFLPAGTHMHLALSISGRDPRQFQAPLEFQPERRNAARHIAFGRGPHICLGMFIARAQIEEGLHIIARRLRDPERAGEVQWRTFPGVWGPRSLPIRFTPAGAA